MKQIGLILFVNLFFLSQIFGQVFRYPSCSYQGEKDLRISCITLGESFTTIEFEYTSSKSVGNYIFLSPPNTTGAYYIKSNVNEYNLKSTSGIGDKDGITAAPSQKTIKFSATFYAIPKNLKEFDLIEGSSGSWNFFGIKLSSNENSIIETKILKSEAKMRESDTPLSNTIYTLPAGTQVNILSLIGSYYKIEYKGVIGYINEVYFQSSGNSSNRSSSNITNTENELPPLNSNNEEDWKSYYNKNLENLYDLEGIYTCSYSLKVVNYYLYEKVVFSNNYGPATIAIYKNGDKFYSKLLKTYHNGTSIDGIDLSTFVSFVFSPSSSETNFTGVVSFDSKYTTTFNCIFNDGKLDFGYQVPQKFTVEKNSNNNTHKEIVNQAWVKSYPSILTYNEKIKKSNSQIPQSISGTGFALTSNGIIATNNHVIEGAKNIKVRGINDDFSRTYTAKLLTTDRNNDLALIKIDDYSFSTLGTIPYVIKSTGSNVGENIFVLGYPLRATMGDEIKLTNGIISSKTGFQGDVTAYQISAPVQPGNSGGPLFDNQGNLIGIVNAKHTGAENASYAVKVSYLSTLINLLDYPPTLQEISIVGGKPLTQQVSIVKKFVFIIEVN